MFPLKDNIPARHLPLVNVGLIAVNVVFFGYEYSLGRGLDRFILEFGFIPARFITQQAENLLNMGRFVPIFTSMFMHANLLHLLSNMWMLWIFGDNVEDCMGHGRYLVFYLLCGLASVFVQGAFAATSQTPMLGASGAIAGVLGAYFLVYPHARILTLVPVFILFYLFEIPAYVFLGLWFLMQFLQGSIFLSSASLSGGGIAWWAHVGGFGAGVLLINFFRRGQGGRRAARRLWSII